MAVNNAINLSDAGIASHDGAGKFVGRTVSGTTDEIDLSNGNGVSGNPTVGLADDLVMPGTGAYTWVDGTTAQRPTAAAGLARFNTTTSKFEGSQDGSTWENFITSGSSGNVVQVVNVIDSAVATGTTAIPFDDTIPQNTEGDEYMTLAITPTSSSNVLIIEVVAQCYSTAAGAVTVALFQDSTAGALAASVNESNNNEMREITLRHYMTAGTGSSTTFKIRIGGVSGTTTFNGYGGARRYGGVSSSSITISEIVP